MSAPAHTWREAADERLTNQARKALAAFHRWAKRREAAAAQAAAAQEELAIIHRQTCERFGRDIPTDALLLDVLDSVAVEPGDRWIWHGLRNNYGLPTVKGDDRREQSLVRFLALAFGIIGEDDYGTLYPENGDRDDVNPWHRTLRRAERPTGNPDRFGFRLTEDGDQ
jgi:hypothetical protein